MEEINNIQKIERLVKLFKPERIAYLIICIITCLFLISCAIILMIKDSGKNIHIILGMFGSAGTITIAIGRLMKMWNDTIKIVFNN